MSQIKNPKQLKVVYNQNKKIEPTKSMNAGKESDSETAESKN